ncbi:MAG TPA: thioredoxin domain-containing protein [Gammaproteobacteria bacterium]|nr:thioredoxin domain-containing protein [Gammaproteobacteria bacterium]HIL95387.1 thioredoxin domain-containing protein [Pseudomonadales bacterium]
MRLENAGGLLVGLLCMLAMPVTAVLIDPPGADSRGTKLRHDLHAAYLQKKGSYVVRSSHMDDDGVPTYTNRLVHEDSPYLLQHAHNPVDWHPWGPSAFALAVEENKLVFLSIGYSTCHWCHVMERESFDNEDIARLLNENFIAIKVDREQRPDLDEIYMTGVQLMTGRGGWPMSSFLTNEGKPFYGGTYFPPRDFVLLLNQVKEFWRTRHDDLLRQADEVTAAVTRITSAQSEAKEINHAVVKNAVQVLIARHDPAYGGFGRGIKFPQESNLLLLLHAWQRDDDESALRVATKTLDAMAAGGIYDQFGGGFHRYSTDRKWQVPHFEKMLYNQAQLVRAYTKAYEVTHDAAYRRVVQQTLDFVLRDMSSEAGSFYSAWDADSEGEEGLFYLWMPEQMADVLSRKELVLVQDLFRITDPGNFEGKNIPTLPSTLEAYSVKNQLELSHLIADVARIRGKLTSSRTGRIPPLRDEKVISAWNGMMISAFVLAARELEREDYLQAAIKAGEEIWSRAWSKEHQLRRIILHDHASTAAGLEDYAYLGESYVFLFDATADALWRERAELLAAVMVEKFWDSERGGFFLAQVHVEEPSIARPKSPADGAIGSGNAVALNLLVRLYERSGELHYRQRIIDTINAFSGLIQASPANFSTMLLGVSDYNQGSVESVQFSRAGHVKAVARLKESRGFEINLSISPGWHINAHQVNQADLIATRVETRGTGRTLDKIDYPSGHLRQLGFQEAPLNLYEGRLVISGAFNEGAMTALPLELHLQACNDEICLAPEWLNFRLYSDDTPSQ